MTAFFQWWADHWPLIPVLLLYPIWGYEAMLAWERVRAWRNRRREP